MELTFLGAAREVGRSGVLLDTGESKVLMDYGLKLSSEEGDGPAPPLKVKGFVDSVILSHAHLDHSGAIPFLFKKGEPRVYTHPATIPIAELLISDSINIMRSKKKKTYQRSSLKRMMRNVKPTPYDKKFNATPDVSFKMTDAGHVLGAGMTTLDAKGKKIVYSGDYKDTDTRLHKGAKLPKKADVLIVEATYGGRTHPPRKKLEKEFSDKVKEVLEAGGSVLLPCFAVGRSQEIVELLYSSKINAPVFLDGMGRKITEFYFEFPHLLRDYEEFYGAMKWVNWITHPRQRETVFNEPSVVVTTAGMLSGGPVMEYLPELKNLNNSAVFFTGFQVPGTPGRRFLEEKKFEVAGADVDFGGTRIEYFDFSAHCDRKGVQDLIKSCDPSLVLVNHGEEEQCEEVVEWVEDEVGCFAFAPKLRESFKVEDFL
jgi:putative mRNA 3-end processing factor